MALRQSEEELKEARREAARRSIEVRAQTGEVQKLQEELRRNDEEMRSVIKQKQSLSSHIRQLGQELEELRSKHQVTGSNQSISNPSFHPFIHQQITVKGIALFEVVLYEVLIDSSVY